MDEDVGERDATREIVRDISGVCDAGRAVAFLVEAARVAMTAVAPRLVLFH